MSEARTFAGVSLGLSILVMIALVPYSSADATASATSSSVENDGVREATRQLLIRAFPMHAARLRVEVKRVNWSDDAQVAGGPKRAEFAVPPVGLPRGSTKINLFGSTTSGSEEAGWAIVYVAHFDTLASLTTNKQRGELLNINDVVPVLTDVTRASQSQRFADLVALMEDRPIEVSSNLSAGSVLRHIDIHVVPDVALGKNLTMTMTRGTLSFAVPVVARESGAVGDAIRVYSPELKTTYKARVVDSDNVHWIETP